MKEKNTQPLTKRIEPIALNIVRITLEDGTQFTLQELDNHLSLTKFPRTLLYQQTPPIDNN